MFGIGSTEFIVIAVIAIIVLGPERCVDLFRQAGKLLRNLRAEVNAAKDVFHDRKPHD